MAVTIDKGSITARATGDPKVFDIGFDFTDEVVDPAQGWLVKWLHAEFRYNTNWTNTQFNAAATAAMNAARKPAAETTLENTLKAKYGVTVVRVNPSVEESYMKVEIAAISDGITLPTKEVV